MTKKDYDNITRALAHSYQIVESRQQLVGVNVVKSQVMKQLEASYPNFDKIKFLNSLRVWRTLANNTLAD